jgi:hypothetical protein
MAVADLSLGGSEGAHLIQFGGQGGLPGGREDIGMGVARGKARGQINSYYPSTISKDRGVPYSSAGSRSVSQYVYVCTCIFFGFTFALHDV